MTLTGYCEARRRLIRSTVSLVHIAHGHFVVFGVTLVGVGKTFGIAVIETAHEFVDMFRFLVV